MLQNYSQVRTVKLSTVIGCVTFGRGMVDAITEFKHKLLRVLTNHSVHVILIDNTGQPITAREDIEHTPIQENILQADLHLHECNTLPSKLPGAMNLKVSTAKLPQAVPVLKDDQRQAEHVDVLRQQPQTVKAPAGHQPKNKLLHLELLLCARQTQKVNRARQDHELGQHLLILLEIADTAAAELLGQDNQGDLKLIQSGKLAFGKMELCLAFFSIGSHGTLVFIMRRLMLNYMHILCPSKEWLTYIEQTPHLCAEDPAMKSVGTSQTTSCHFCPLHHPDTDQQLIDGHKLYCHHPMDRPEGGNVLLLHVLTAVHHPLLHHGLAGALPQQTQQTADTGATVSTDD
jgi:hypothetical protein